MKKFIALDGNRVMLTHSMPFDPIEGLGKTEAELSKMGVLLDEIPDPEEREGYTALPYYTPEKGYYYEYKPVESPTASAADIQGLNAKLDYFMMMQEVI